MELQDTLFIWFNVSVVVMFMMGCFLYKYYPTFDYKDKLIIAYLRMVFILGIAVYIVVKYKFDQPILIFMPAGFIYGIYRIVRLHQTKGEQLAPTITDKRLLAWLQLFTSILGIIFVNLNKHHLTRFIFVFFYCIFFFLSRN